MNRVVRLRQISLGLFFLVTLFLPVPWVYAGWSSMGLPLVSSDWELFEVRFLWAVGQDFQNKQGVLLHYENNSWTKVQAPNVSSDWGLAAIDFASTNEGWAVGTDNVGGTGVLLHYSNGTWTSVVPPIELSTEWGLSAVDSISSSGGWMVGQDLTYKKGILLHYENILVTPPVLSTTNVSEITTTTAKSGGSISSDGGASVTARGVCWDTSINPVAGGNCTSDGTGTGSFTSSISGLSPSTVYHVRAYATNEAGTGYGGDVPFTTLGASALPVVVTATPLTIANNPNVTSGGTINSDGGSALTDWGVCYDTAPNPVVGGTCISSGTGTPPSTFPLQFTTTINVALQTLYHIRAYASNSVGTGYGNDVTFTVPVQDVLMPGPTSTLDTTSTITRLELTLATLPDISSDWGLSGVRQVWAVGQDNANQKGVLLHFVNGTWISVEPPDISSDWGLLGLDLLSANDVWAVGRDNVNKRGVLLHFSNGSWTSVTPPDVSSDWGLSAANFISSNEGWAVGQNNESQTGVLLHYADGSWTLAPPPSLSSDWGLSAVYMIYPNQGWAVGRTDNGQSVRGLLLQYAIPQLSVSPVTINYRDVEIGASSDQTVVVRNTGNGGLAIGDITPPSAPFSILADDCSQKTLAPLKTCTVTYRFLPDAEGSFSDNSTVPSSESSVTVALTGTGSAGAANYIQLSCPPDGQTFVVCPDLGSPLFQWESSGTFAGIDLQFSLTPSFSKIPVRVKGNPNANEITVPTGTWKKVLLLPGVDGGGVYWTVVATKKDKSIVEGDILSFEVTGATPVTNPELSHSSKTTVPPPTLSWENQCNTKFKAWFGNSANFQNGAAKKVAVSFSVKDPNENQGIFAKALTSGQWSSIRRLGGNVTGAVLYWYVESWDALGRKKQTDVTSFTLTD